MSDAADAPEIDAIMAEYLDARAAGDDVDLDALCARHPTLANELRQLVPILESLDRQVSTVDGGGLGSIGRSAVTTGLLELFDELDLPAEVPRYDVEATIGRGGMGEVVRVFDRDLDRHLAMKRSIDSVRHHSPGARLAWLRFLTEARLTGGLEHPGIVPVHEVGTREDGRPYFTMRLVRGRELGEVFDDQRDGDPAWPQARVLGVIAKVCEAVAYAHDRGIVHRDLKPSNVMVGAFGEVYVMDWGIARRVDEDDDEDVTRDGAASAAVGMTVEGSVLGTPCYMPPEQARGELDRVDFRADVYAVGAMLYQLLAGFPPYLLPVPAGRRRDDSALGVVERVCEGPPTSLELAAPGAPLELVAIAERAMAREPRDRYADMGGLADDLRAFLEHRVVRAYRTGAIVELTKWIRRNRATAAAIAVAFVAVAVGLVASLVLFAEAESSRVTAEREREGVLRLSALRDLDRLHDRADALWPVTAESAMPLREWTDDLATLRLELDPARALLGDLESGEIARAVDARSRDWWAESVRDFIAGMDAIDDPESGLAGTTARSRHGLGIGARLEIAEQLRDELGSDGEWAARREAARAEVAAIDDAIDLDAAAFADLVPLGSNSSSGLMEFWHVPSGEEPQRSDDGALIVAEETGMVLVLIPQLEGHVGGQSDDRSAPNYDPMATYEDGPVRLVECGPLLVSKYEMTQGQWLRANGENPSEWRAGRRPLPGDLRHPVETVDQARCAVTLSRFGLRFPSMDEWEVVARGGEPGPFPWPSDESPGDFGNFHDANAAADGSPIDDGWEQTAPVGSYEPNPLGLHDVFGNVAELCDIVVMEGMVQRGGSMVDQLQFSRASSYRPIVEAYAFGDLGLRPVRGLP